ncbi:MAG: hypothetical protein ACE37F_07235 [Nannocystaceae bacterium]|nr:hypothetical protein [bacterium]
MGNIGSIYDDAPAGEGRGPDLRATVEVPRAGLGAADGVCVPLPAALPHEGEDVLRTPQPGEPEDAVTLRLPADFPDGATLRLRGAGGRGTEGSGDLYLTVSLADDAIVVAPAVDLAPTQGSSAPIVVSLAIAAAIALLYVLLS